MEAFERIKESPKRIYLVRAANAENAGGFLSEEEYSKFKTLYSANPLLAIQRMNSAIAAIGSEDAKKRYCDECVSLESAVEREIIESRGMRYGIETETRRGLPYFLFDGFVDMGYYSNEMNRTREKLLVDKKKLAKHLACAKAMSIMFPERSEAVMARMVAGRINYDKDIAERFVEEKDFGLIGLNEFLEEQIGVCRHFAMLYQLFAQEAGIESRIVKGYLGKRPDGGLHAWNMAHRDKNCFLVDTSGSYLQDNKDGSITRCIMFIQDSYEGRCYRKARAYGKQYRRHERNRNFYKYRYLEF
ncbi:MAG: transglutaminase-like domain-containing protein [Nanoarchaeota archaeon]|nr:transglutaminase-like domain-containing protein [Nanoarchaeota archaeon]